MVAVNISFKLKFIMLGIQAAKLGIKSDIFSIKE
jgi:hypothetical protein